MRNNQARTVLTESAPAAIGPYSQGIVAGDFVFVSGQLPIDPKTGEFVEGEIDNRAAQVINNIKAVLEKAGSNLNQIVKSTVYLTDLSCYAAVNKVYADYFQNTLPARSVVVVAALPKNADIEMDVIAYIPGTKE
jgi:2-iminobutanoate/2-iminopropanoate deaminase